MSLVIDDAHIDDVKKFIMSQSRDINCLISQYVRTMNDVVESGYMEGETAIAVREFLSQVKSKVSDKGSSLSEIESQAERFCTNFIKKVDKTDKDIY